MKNTKQTIYMRVLVKASVHAEIKEDAKRHGQSIAGRIEWMQKQCKGKRPARS